MAVTRITYHDTVNDLHGLGLAGKGPFANVAWFALLERAGAQPFVALASRDGETIALPLHRRNGGLEPLTNWYAFTWAPLASRAAPAHLLDGLAVDLASHKHITFDKLTAEMADRLEATFRKAGWFTRCEESDTNHVLDVGGRSYADYLAARPGPLRTTLKRKAKKVDVVILRVFDDEAWDTYEAIYAKSWKPTEGDPGLLRAFARQQATAGHMLMGMAFADGAPVAAQFWTVEDGVAYIHKLAHLPEAEKLSPGTTLTAALMQAAIDEDRVREVDFGTGDDGYKADWMEAVRPRYRLTCLRAGKPANWPRMAKMALRTLVSHKRAG
jgi:hypothetical protein